MIRGVLDLATAHQLVDDLPDGVEIGHFIAGGLGGVARQRIGQHHLGVADFLAGADEDIGRQDFAVGPSAGLLEIQRAAGNRAHDVKDPLLAQGDPPLENLLDRARVEARRVPGAALLASHVQNRRDAPRGGGRQFLQFDRAVESAVKLGHQGIKL